MATIEGLEAKNVVESPLWWLDRLHKKLLLRRDEAKVLTDYYEGENLPLRFATEKFREGFQRIFRDLNDNWCAPVIDAVQERLKPTGFRVIESPEGELDDTPEEESQADQAAWAIYQRNDLEAGFQLGLNEALVAGGTNALVWGTSDGLAEITFESVQETLIEYVPGSRKLRAAGYKEWRDDWTGKAMATLYLPDFIYKFQSKGTIRGDMAATKVNWEVREDPDDDTWPLENTLKVVPMIPMENKPRLLRPYDSEIRTIIPIQDAINKEVIDMMVASEYQAFRQRWATGIEIPTDPDTNQPVEPFKAAVDRLWAVESETAKFGEFEQIDLRIFVAVIEMWVQHVATLSRTPPHYFFLKGEFPSGESIKSAETGLVAKTWDKMGYIGDDLETMMRLAFFVEDDPRADATNMQTIWKDPESRTEGEHTDAMIKLKAINVPDEILWEKWGFTPQEIERMKKMREAEKAEEAKLAKEQAPLPEGEGGEEEEEKPVIPTSS